MRRKARHISEEEAELWDKIRQTARPLKLKHAPAEWVPKPAKHRAEPKRQVEGPNAALSTAGLPDISFESFMLGEKAKPRLPGHDLAPAIGSALAAAPVQMDAKKHRHMTRGRLSPEARIDLHGLTLAEAHPDLVSFILRAHAADFRLVLVITGKGKDRDAPGPIPVRHGVLKHQVPHWLNLPPLRQLVLQVTEAHLRHGGSGAYYVYLRRR